MIINLFPEMEDELGAIITLQPRRQRWNMGCVSRDGTWAASLEMLLKAFLKLRRSVMGNPSHTLAPTPGESVAAVRGI